MGSSMFMRQNTLNTLQRTFFFVQVANGEELIGQVVHDGAKQIEYFAENVDQVVHGAILLVHVVEHIVQAVPVAEHDGSACPDLKEEQPCVADECSLEFIPIKTHS